MRAELVIPADRPPLFIIHAESAEEEQALTAVFGCRLDHRLALVGHEAEAKNGGVFATSFSFTVQPQEAVCPAPSAPA